MMRIAPYIAAMYSETRSMTTYGDGDGWDNNGNQAGIGNVELTAQYQLPLSLDAQRLS